ncbi:MAG: hypothetical protein EPN56_13615 [Rhodanobacter sp.]|nr:MAG: hypothetical protein EPN78_09270 [Rhodanobacter sp.]TAM12012.1 MAG: hypothetical protein EPN66_07255 [Rhodanobacter sp.]TAM34647.1 MAG: hypothetical protein EPN56_13615 [Rhodanobacter sp.]
MSKHWMVGLGLAACVLALPGAAMAADVGAATKQAATASAHAGMALGAANLATAEAHLQHVVNCLVGTAGTGFDAKAANPCKGMGQGAIPDAKGDAALTTRLEAALADANAGLKATTLEAAHAAAKKTMDALQAK